MSEDHRKKGRIGGEEREKERKMLVPLLDPKHTL